MQTFDLLMMLYLFGSPNRFSELYVQYICVYAYIRFLPLYTHLLSC